MGITLPPGTALWKMMGRSGKRATKVSQPPVEPQIQKDTHDFFGPLFTADPLTLSFEGIFALIFREDYDESNILLCSRGQL